MARPVREQEPGVRLAVRRSARKILDVRSKAVSGIKSTHEVKSRQMVSVAGVLKQARHGSKPKRVQKGKLVESSKVDLSFFKGTSQSITQFSCLYIHRRP